MYIRDPYELVICTVDEEGYPLPIWRWCNLPAYRVHELESKAIFRELEADLQKLSARLQELDEED